MRMKGVFFTMDAAAALLIMLVFISTTVSMLAVSDHSSEDVIYMTRLARDAYEADRLGDIPFWVKMNDECRFADERSNITALEYDNSTNSIVLKSVMVCP